MTTVVVYDEFKGLLVHLAGGGHEDQSIEILAGATRQFKLEPGQSFMIDGGEKNDEPNPAPEDPAHAHPFTRVPLAEPFPGPTPPAPTGAAADQNTPPPAPDATTEKTE